MAKATKKVNKSQTIRDYKKAHPSAKAVEIKDALAKQGIKFSTTFVYTVLAKGKKKKARRQRGAASGRQSANGMVSVDLLKSAMGWADSCGSIEEAIEALRIVERIRKPR